MTPRRRRAAIALGVLVVVAGAGALVLDALRGNVVFFFTPTQVADKAVPAGHNFRVGGLVEQGSLGRDGLQVNFIITDTVHRLPVRYHGALPDLFKEGKGVVAQGKLGGDGVFDALEMLAKHDENYMPPDAAQALKLAKDGMKGPQP